MSVADVALGKWQQILPQLGVAAAHLSGRHGPCPVCGGTDRFRFDDKAGKGTWFCNHCGAGDGIGLLMRTHRWTYQEAARSLQVALEGFSAPRQPASRAQRPAPKGNPQSYIESILSECCPLSDGDAVSAYLRGRGLHVMPETLLCHPRLAYFHDGRRTSSFPTLVARVEGPGGDLRSLHRTYTQNARKADVPVPRKFTPPITKISGAAARLFPCAEHIGVAEGIETAIAAYELFDLPVWAALNATLLEEFQPPPGVRHVTVFGDNDRNHVGQIAANRLAHRLEQEGRLVEVRIPGTEGWDFLDVLNARTKATEVQR